MYFHWFVREPFFDARTHEDDEDDDEQDGFFDGFHRDQQDPFNGTGRFGFSVGPDGARFQEPQAFAQIFREMEEIFSQFGHIGMIRPWNVCKVILDGESKTLIFY